MGKSNPPNQEVVGDQLTEEISELKQISLGEGAATCQVCGSSFHEGDAVTVYVFRPAEEVMFQVGHAVCGDGEHELPTVFTLGVRELLVEGRVGLCSDGAMQSSWPVLLEPEIVAVSVEATKSVRQIPDGGSFANAEAGVENREMPESMAKVSLGEAWRRADRPDGDVVRGLFWGDVQR